MYFTSDNQSCASQPILDAIVKANHGFTHGYGDNHYTLQAISQLKATFECDLEVFFVPTGTAANCLALASLVLPWQTILCHSSSHIIMDESTAPEFFTGGARMVGIAQHASKISIEHIQPYLALAGDDTPHNPQVGAISITQANVMRKAVVRHTIPAPTRMSMVGTMSPRNIMSAVGSAIRTLKDTRFPTASSVAAVNTSAAVATAGKQYSIALLP